MKKVILFALFLLSFSSLALAKQYEVDQAHSNVGFTVRHLMSKVSGAFKEFSGTFNYDEKNVAKSDVNFTIKTASIDTDNDKRDDHLRSADFFDAGKFPEITFKSTKVTKGAGKKFKITGDLTMHGVTKPVTLDAEYLGAAKGFQGETRAGFTATGKVNRKDYGITWSKVTDAGSVVVGDEVTLNFNIEAIEKAADVEKAKEKAEEKQTEEQKK